ncbi:MAG: trigger factor [Acidobacteriota bacterium]
MEIQVKLEDISSIKKKLKVEIPVEVAQKEFNQVVSEYKKYARLPGFRPGKAPAELVKRRFIKDIRNDVLQKLVPESYDQAVKQQGMTPLGQPNLENLQFEEGQPLVYEALFEIPPEISLPEFKGLEVNALSALVSEEDLEEQLENLRQQHARLVSVQDRPVQEGDFAVIDLRGEYLVQEGEHDHEHEPIQDENVSVEVGGEHTHKDFNEALLGMNIAEEKSFEVEYAGDYPEKKLAGHRVHFTVQVTDIKQKELPELNDEFVKDLGAELENLEQLKNKIRETLLARRQDSRENDLKNKLMDQLVEQSSFEVPDVLVEDRIDDKIRDVAYNMAAQGVDPSRVNIDWRKVRADLKPEAEKEVRASMILAEIAQQETLEVSDDDQEAEFQRRADSLEQPIEKVRQHFLQDDRLEGLRSQIRRRKALELVFESATITDEELQKAEE